MTHALIHPHRIAVMQEGIKVHDFLTHYFTGVFDGKPKRFTTNEVNSVLELIRTKHLIEEQTFNSSVRQRLIEKHHIDESVFANYVTHFSLAESIALGLSHLKSYGNAAISAVIAEAIGKSVVITIAVHCVINRKEVKRMDQADLVMTIDLATSLNALTGSSTIYNRIIYQAIQMLDTEGLELFLMPLITPYLRNTADVLSVAKSIISKIDALAGDVEPEDKVLIDLIGKFNDESW